MSTRARMTATSLALESLTMFFATLAAFPLADDPRLAGTVGMILVALLGAGTALARKPYGVKFGWILQGLFLATGVIFLPMLLLAPIFIGLHWWLDRIGTRIDRDRGAAQEIEHIG